MPVRTERPGSLAAAGALDLVVLRPPVTARQCDVMAAEDFAFCPDNSSPQTGFDDQPISRADDAARLRGATAWHFWWD
ncbi:DUF4253 domain-containing protein [Modestobacter roseus]|uniref:DUF4253 domain-containing protein n=1 Tax=Modestobacter roseus TaxID=1181884 RepID=UPI00141251B9|nr:DUF4253 domain-containing protein [Modestobacter roseus]